MASVIVFFIFLFLFNVVNPDITTFQDVYFDGESLALSKAGGSIFNQLYWFSILLLGCTIVMTRLRRFTQCLSSLFPLVLLILWCVASVLWSEHDLISLRRAFFLVIIFLSLYIASIYAADSATLIKMAYFAALFALALNLVSIALPFGFHLGPSLTGAFKGIHGHKNTAGMIAVIALILGLLVRPYLMKRVHKSLNSTFLIGWTILLILSSSKTSLAALIASSIIVYCAYIIARVNAVKASVGAVLLVVITMLVLSFLWFEAANGVSLNDILTKTTGQKEVTFTGRTDLWSFTIEYLSEKWLFGHGFGGFWNVGLDSDNFSLVSKWNWIKYVNQAHNGYIDIVVNVGLIGIALFIVVLIQFSRQMEVVRIQSSRTYLILWTMMVFALIHNMMESSIIRTTHPIWLMMLFIILMAARAADDYWRTNYKQVKRSIL